MNNSFNLLIQYSKNTAFITDRGEVFSYAWLLNEAKLFGARVVRRGLVFCLCKNEIGALIGYVSGMCNEIPLVLLDGGCDREYIISYISKYLPEYLWVPSYRSSDFDGPVIYERYGYSLVQMEYTPNNVFSCLHDKLALCLTTSGSTGSPKLVRLTKSNLVLNAQSIANYLTINDKERPITTLPIYYSFGLSVINSHLIKGATILLTDKSIFTKSFWDFFEQTSPTSIAGVPFTYEVLEKMGFFKMVLPSLKTMIQAGGKLSVDIVKRYAMFANETNKKFVVMYGQTEASPRMSYLPFDKALIKPSSVGIPIPGGEFILYGEDDNPIQEPNVEGELVYKGGNVCMGYAECREDLRKGDENNGFLRTGDIAYKDADGYYYITGRIKRFVKIWGNRYNLDAIEQLIKPITPDCACVGTDSKIFVVITDSTYINIISQLLSKKLKLDKSCYSVIVMEKIPKTSSGKIQYADINCVLG